MLIKQLIQILQHEYSKGIPSSYLVNDALKYYYESYNKDEIKKNKILLSQFNMNTYNKLVVHTDKNFSLNMILWGKNSYTRTCSHTSNRDLMVMEGSIVATKYEDSILGVNCLKLESGDVYNLKGGSFHNLINAESSKSLTLHVYDNYDYFRNLNLLMG